MIIDFEKDNYMNVLISDRAESHDLTEKWGMNLNLNDFKHLFDHKEFKLKIEIVDGVEVGILTYAVQSKNIWNYNNSREARGITFNMKTGQIICRPFHKFFNVDENKYSQRNNIDWDNIVIMKKLDGSLVTPVLINNKVFWKSKSSFYSDVARKTQKLYENSDVNFKLTIENYLKNGKTPIFEYISPDNRIVVEYQEETLVLLNVRDIQTGKYTGESETISHIEKSILNIDELINYVRNLKDIEGFVVFDGNDFYKIKTNWYIERHHIISGISYRTILEYILNDSIDDYVSTINQLGYKKLSKEILKMWDKVVNYYYNLESEIMNIYESNSGKEIKDFAIYVHENYSKYSAVLFDIYKKKDYNSNIKKLVYNHFNEKWKGKKLFKE